MYKGTERFVSFHQRTASSSTKGHAGGRVEALPPDARPWEQIFNSVREQHRIALEKLTAAQVKLGLLFENASEDLPEPELTQIAREIPQCEQELRHYRGIVEDLEHQARQAAQNTLGYCFMVAAKHALTEAQFEALTHTARQMTKGTGLHDDLPQPMPDPVARLPKGRRTHLAHLRGEIRNPTQLSPVSLRLERSRAQPPVVEKKEVARERDHQGKGSALETAMRKAVVRSVLGRKSGR